MFFPPCHSQSICSTPFVRVKLLVQTQTMAQTLLAQSPIKLWNTCRRCCIVAGKTLRFELPGCSTFLREVTSWPPSGNCDEINSRSKK